jgi:uncharacterized membrane protein
MNLSVSTSTIIQVYGEFLHGFAEIIAYTLELVGILIIMVGSVKALLHLVRRLRYSEPFNVVIDLGRSLALALEFKMGAEIINTVIVHSLTELATLAIVILIRALLAVIIHWEIKMERQEEKDEKK